MNSPVSPTPIRIRVGRNSSTFDTGEVILIGRDPTSTIVVDSDLVSRKHVRICWEDGCWTVTHLSAKNPTFVEREPISTLALRQRCTLRLSRVDHGPAVEIDFPALESGARPLAARYDADGPTIGTKTQFGTFTEEFRPTERRVTIGRAQTNDIVLAEDLTVSSKHAELVSTDGISWEILDRDSRNGTFVDGARIRRQVLRADSRINIGGATFQFDRDTLRRFETHGEVTFEASGITVLAPSGKDKGKVLLDNVTFRLPERCVLGVLGPSGSGKSTLVRALAGFRFGDRGSVAINGDDLYANYDSWRSRIGYVPQDDILHTSLTVDKALTYAAELRFDGGDDPDAVGKRIDEVLVQLRLGEHRSKVISSLSGGQRKRVSVALELLSKPDVIFLDEPTSGLDPGNEKSLMQELRTLADDPKQGRTIAVITHSIQSLDLCDRLLILSRGGGLAFFGRPDEALKFFGASDYADVFDHLEKIDKASAQARYRNSPQYREYVEPIVAVRTRSINAANTPSRPRSSQSKFRQFTTLTRRYVDVVMSDRRSLAGLLVQAPAIGIVLSLLSARGLRSHSHLANSKAGLTLLSLVLAVSFLGASNAFREIVKERAIVRRERSFGLSIAAYLASKVAVLGVLTVLQGFILVFVGTLAAQGPAKSILISPPKIELAIGISLAGLAAMALGLTVSAFAKNGDRAASMLPLLLLVMYLLSGGPSDPHNLPGVGELSYLNSAKWGFSAAASTANLQELNKCVDGRSSVVQAQVARRDLDSSERPSPKEYDDQCKHLWSSDRGHLLADVSALTAMTIGFLMLAGFLLTRLRD